MRRTTRIGMVFLMAVMGSTQLWSATQEQALEAYMIANLSYLSNMMSVSTGSVDGISMAMTAQGYRFTFEEFDLTSLAIESSIPRMFLLGSRYRTVSGTLLVSATGTVEAEFVLTGGPVTTLKWVASEDGTIKITANGREYSIN